jgi:hypothetical protein
MPVEVAGDLAMRALTERINGSQWVVSAGYPIAQYEHKDPFVGLTREQAGIQSV